MVSAVFHSPSEVDDAAPATAASPAQIAPAPVQKAAPTPGSSPAKPPVDWVGWALRTVSPLAGIALRIHLKVEAVREATEEEIGRGNAGTGFFRIAPQAPGNDLLH